MFVIYDGQNGGTVELLDDVLVIRRKGLTSLLNHGLKGDKRIPYESITSVQFKEAGFTTGYIQFGVAGGKESRAGVGAAVKDENTVLFIKKTASEFRQLRDLVEQRSIAARRGPPQATSSNGIADELRALAELRSAGILTDTEFQEQKSKLLSRPL
ncbi:hypothetical protein ASE82_11740 [Sphingomonas sp. Leaf230]|uniref:DUF4429 domain-containing protein n=1 Tax=Sphingomonas sp. Leaf230 TaxID=1735694 RepID=UPI0006FB1454|nr:DUF4429 domain-containing protein [Sphingomonas sp. Leaf230]KQN01947.1 hypothetical protein ASE82_11740 [Sphingomonas sp. Leaf230]